MGDKSQIELKASSHRKDVTVIFPFKWIESLGCDYNFIYFLVKSFRSKFSTLKCL